MARINKEIPESQIKAQEACQRTLDSIDEKKEKIKISYFLDIPVNPIYRPDGIHPSWRSWIREGRYLHPYNAQGRNNYIEKLKQRFPSMKIIHLREIIRELESSEEYRIRTSSLHPLQPIL